MQALESQVYAAKEQLSTQTAALLESSKSTKRLSSALKASHANNTGTGPSAPLVTALSAEPARLPSSALHERPKRSPRHVHKPAMLRRRLRSGGVVMKSSLKRFRG